MVGKLKGRGTSVELGPSWLFVATTSVTWAMTHFFVCVCSSLSQPPAFSSTHPEPVCLIVPHQNYHYELGSISFHEGLIPAQCDISSNLIGLKTSKLFPFVSPAPNGEATLSSCSLFAFQSSNTIHPVFMPYFLCSNNWSSSCFPGQILSDLCTVLNLSVELKKIVVNENLTLRKLKNVIWLMSHQDLWDFPNLKLLSPQCPP